MRDEFSTPVTVSTGIEPGQRRRRRVELPHPAVGEQKAGVRDIVGLVTGDPAALLAHDAPELPVRTLKPVGVCEGIDELAGLVAVDLDKEFAAQGLEVRHRLDPQLPLAVDSQP